MAHDVLALGVVLGLVVEALNGGHLPALLGDLDAVSDTDAVAIDSDWGEKRKCELCPQRSERVEFDSG